MVLPLLDMDDPTDVGAVETPLDAYDEADAFEEPESLEE